MELDTNLCTVIEHVKICFVELRDIALAKYYKAQMVIPRSGWDSGVTCLI